MEIALTIVFPTGNRFDTLVSYKDAKLRRKWVEYFQAGDGIVSIYLKFLICIDSFL